MSNEEWLKMWSAELPQRDPVWLAELKGIVSTPAPDEDE